MKGIEGERKREGGREGERKRERERERERMKEREKWRGLHSTELNSNMSVSKESKLYSN